MMRSILVRLAAVAFGVVLVASCDTRLPTAVTPVTTPSTSTSATNKNKPTIVVDSPLVGTLINLGDSVLVSVHMHAGKASLKSAALSGVTESGSTDLGTFKQTPRYREVLVPAAGSFRPGLRDTTIRRYLQP